MAAVVEAVADDAAGDDDGGGAVCRGDRPAVAVGSAGVTHRGHVAAAIHVAQDAGTRGDVDGSVAIHTTCRGAVVAAAVGVDAASAAKHIAVVVVAVVFLPDLAAADGDYGVLGDVSVVAAAEHRAVDGAVGDVHSGVPHIGKAGFSHFTLAGAIHVAAHMLLVVGAGVADGTAADVDGGSAVVTGTA